MKRFGFGENWKAFSEKIDQERLSEAKNSLQYAFQLEDFSGRVFLDIGCGSGLFSLAALQLGARVISIDYDPDSVACGENLRDVHGIQEQNWCVYQGSILDDALVSEIGKADLVYCWGVVHHTGNMKKAISNVASLVSQGGSLCLAVYNQQGSASRRWLRIKQLYNRMPGMMKPIYVLAVASVFECRFAVVRVLKFQNPLPFSEWAKKKKDRGMSAWHDWVDWVGGLPFEVASPEDVILQLRPKGFVLENLKTVCGGWGCNEYLFSLEEKI
ncbi:MAG: class I SAM-dependent methyltransferase [Planctomycetota bacterium]|nr:class I SAM-dependent methyltransferase [Planctomycetota bacterium]